MAAPNSFTGTSAGFGALGTVTILSPATGQVLLWDGNQWSNANVESATGGTVSSIGIVGGTSGMTFSNSPITSSGTMTMSGTLVVGSGGTGLTTLNVGRIPFGAGTSPLGSTDNLFYDSSNNRLGVLTPSPEFPLHVGNGSTGINTLAIFQSGDSTARISFKDPSTTSNSQVGVGAVGNDLKLFSRNIDYTWATSDGTDGQVLTTDGSGNLSFTDVSATGVTTINFGTTGLTPNTATGGVVNVAGILNVSNGGIGTSALNRDEILIGNGSNQVATTGPLDDGELLIGRTGTNPATATLTAGSNITITNSAGSIEISATGGGGGLSVGDTITGATVGSILFAGSSGVLAQDNSNLFWEPTNRNLGIGTDSPAFDLEVDGGTADTVALFKSTDATVKIAFVDSTTSTSGHVGVGAEGNNLLLESGTVDFLFPTSDGSNGQVLVTDGSGNLSFTTAGSPSQGSADQFNVADGSGGWDSVAVYYHQSGSGGIKIGSSSLPDYPIAAIATTGSFVGRFVSQVSVAKLAFVHASGSNSAVAFGAESNRALIVSNQTDYLFPSSDGSSGEALVTDGSGNLSFDKVKPDEARSSFSVAGGSTTGQTVSISDSNVTANNTIVFSLESTISGVSFSNAYISARNSGTSFTITFDENNTTGFLQTAYVNYMIL